MEKNLTQGPFYSKLVTTINKIKQFNKMVTGKSEGSSKRKHIFDGMPNPELQAKLDAQEGKSPQQRGSKLSESRHHNMSSNS